MAPKKAASKDGKKKKGGTEGDAELTTADLLNRAALRIESLERQLMWREEKMMEAVRAQKELRERVVQYDDDFKREKEEIFDITADMTRQYKGMQEELMRKINSLESTINTQRDELELARLAHEETRKQKDQVIALKDAEIAEQKQKMEEMAIEFGEMLKETLDKMGERIEVTSSSWELDAGAPIMNRLQEFKLNVADV
ncbi:hypothetical protein T492DRAFT_629254 [Pavlovales sp. CCMP2436]|nr:hypothetical protein T492DRAFT_629254 [Pavlovales sp. CCMP2436]|mmetsp:Transcript_13579/g.34630  ORF Transcript_13579/g.34630 Transcript_13579/m.34630 type:complete len:199 (-) Transcript_13579:142-738(-)|eukprot:CAMPEP_0179896920 /NCGR_PEP_ID=MMETSP0982-20121206/36690_1 /TAXON_ID=483367 /ORGANISM="non described non described, Strain CCMP 2436" /LENGTH=198 /DNA_ID=CAMNT_0021793837 /DNA_START=75 /DNA_END=671 /DNA_ORIENTATION=-